jgi:hypothetical protein
LTDPPGLKPIFILAGLMYGLKPVPFKLTHYGLYRQVYRWRVEAIR